MAEQVPGRVPGRMSDSLTVELPPTVSTALPTTVPTSPSPAKPVAAAAPSTRVASGAAVLAAPESDDPAEPSRPRDRTPGWREVLIIAAIVVVAVLAIQVVTSNLPVSVQNLLFNTPLIIVLLVGGTVGLLLRITRRPST